MIVSSYCFLIIISIVVINAVIINQNKLLPLDDVFANERHLFFADMINYVNFTNYKSLNELKEIRKKSKYRKKGYGGHPPSHIFSYPLDKKVIITPQINMKTIDLVIFIHCRPDEFYERFIYRKTIAKSSNYIVLYITSKSLIHTVNEKLKRESEKHKDILQFNEISSYFNLSIQTVHMLNWCNNLKFKYIIKTDIDVYINIHLIVDILQKINIKNEYYAIGKVSITHVIRNKKYSHYVPREIIKENMFPPYLQGVGYIIPYKTIKLISNKIDFVKPKIWIEDVFMGYLFKYNNISLINLSKYIIRDLPDNIINLITNINKYILIHGFYPIEIYLLHNMVKK